MRAARTVAALASGLLGLGLVHAPATAAAAGTSAAKRTSVGDRVGSSDGSDDGSDDGSVSVRVPRRADVVHDPSGDAQGRSEGRPRPYSRLADLTRARYRTPSVPGGDLRLTTRWEVLVDGSRRGVRRQTQVTVIYGRTSRHIWLVEVSNTGDRVSVEHVGRRQNTPVRPDRFSVDRTFGPGGTVDVLLSSEWVRAPRVGMYTYAYSGSIKSMDRTDDSRRLDVGPVLR